MMRVKLRKPIIKNKVMYIYAERILMQILAFSLSPLLGLIVTAFGNLKLGLLAMVIGSILIFFQPYFSEQCLRNTAQELGLSPIVLAEGKVVYFGKNDLYQGKLFLTKNELVFVEDNKIDFKISLALIDGVSVKKETNDVQIKDLKPVLEKGSPNLVDLTIMLNSLLAEEGQLVIKVKNSFFSHNYYFQVTVPEYWCQQIIAIKRENT